MYSSDAQQHDVLLFEMLPNLHDEKRKRVVRFLNDGHLPIKDLCDIILDYSAEFEVCVRRCPLVLDCKRK